MKTALTAIALICQLVFAYVLLFTEFVQLGSYLQFITMGVIAILAVVAAWMSGFLDGADAADAENERQYVHQLGYVRNDSKSEYRQLAFPPIDEQFIDSQNHVDRLADRSNGLAVLA